MLASFNSEQYISLYKLSLFCDGYNLKLEIFQIWQYIKKNLYKNMTQKLYVLKVV